MDKLKLLIRKFINYEIIIDRILRFVFLYKHTGSNDAYPPLHYFRKNNMFLSRNFSFNSNTRIKLWTYFAKKYPTFKTFYQTDNNQNTIKDIDKYGGHYKKQILDFYANGVTEIENFFNEEEHEIILEEFKKNIDINFGEKSASFGQKIKNKKVNIIIHNKIRPLEKIIFGKYMKPQNYIISAHLIKNSIFPYKKSVNFHLERFIPSFKFIYFPTAVKSNPFEYYSGSHKIDDQYLNNVKVSQTAEDENLDDSYQLDKYHKNSFYSKANTLVIAATHGLHRRKPEKINGVRRFITIAYYNSFTRYDLIFNYFKSFIINEKN